jgi:uncharacterized membrane protein (UPF0127 family)
MSHFLQSLVDSPDASPLLTNDRTAATLATRLEPAFDSERRRRGLLGRTSLPSGTAMIIAPCWAIHTFFMAFAIDVVFTARDGVVLKLCSGVRPWRIAMAWGAFAAIEVQAGVVATSQLRRGDQLRLVSTEYDGGSCGQ